MTLKPKWNRNLPYQQTLIRYLHAKLLKICKQNSCNQAPKLNKNNLSPATKHQPQKVDNKLMTNLDTSCNLVANLTWLRINLDLTSKLTFQRFWVALLPSRHDLAGTWFQHVTLTALNWLVTRSLVGNTCDVRSAARSTRDWHRGVVGGRRAS